MNELGAEAETLDPAARRERRIKRESDKWDEEHYLYAVVHCSKFPCLNVLHSADFADPEYIESLIDWQNPVIANTAGFDFTEEEKLAMLNLPRVECDSPISTS